MFKKTASVILAALMLSGVVLTATSCDIGDLLSIDKSMVDGIVGDVVGDVTGKPALTDEQMKVIPYVGANGNWWIDETDTGICAVGQDGITPHIGENSNWWIGDTDTGVCAVGKDGDTPQIGYNGNWWLGNTDTGISAKGPKGDKGADGLTPYIGENGNWWIGKTDTGVKAGCDCNKDDGGDTDNPTPTPDPVNPPSTDYEGKVFLILSRESTGYECYADVEDITGSVITQEIYKRNASVEDRLNVKIQVELIPGDYSQKNNFITHIRNNAFTGEEGYDMISGYSAFLPILAFEGIATDMNELPHIDLERAWWSQSMYEEGSIDGKTYMMTGDIVYSMYENMQVVLYNKDIAEQLGIADEDFGVLDATWTFEKMMTMGRNNLYDQNNDGTVDSFGVTVNSQGVRGLLTGMEASLSRRDENGRHQMELSEKTLDAVEALLSFTSENNVIAWNSTEPYSAFESGNAFFAVGDLKLATTFDTVNVGILPTPRYSLEQTEYYTYGRSYTSAIMIPVNCVDAEMSSAVIECLASESYRNVRPAYVDGVLGISLSDTTAYETVEIIFNSYTVPFASLYELVFGTIPYSTVDYCYQNGVEFTTRYSECEAEWSVSLDKLYTMFEALD